MNDSVCSIGTVAVGNVRSDAPTVDDVVASGETSVTGDSTEEGGAIVDVYVNGIYRGWSTVRNNRFSVISPLASRLSSGWGMQPSAGSKTSDEASAASSVNPSGLRS